ncbi:hypothetical protein IG197_01735 [Aminobacter sp. SR38]|jgi:hypothetical protein|uniref:hypothetical protein n=1 Tax=Aminobacter sp. SR38 TaxID=2774562 RepID=UPI00177CEAB2|nr:hypothetical protein [Aminobacter sp. SR38]QOF71838.1 hypothetical protein IG197_01735 [Aminobacter sp. SR38]
MPERSIGDEDHLIRSVAWSKLLKTIDNDGCEQVIGFLHTAFVMRDSEDTLSSTLQEYFTGTPQQQIEAAVRVMRNSKLKISPKSAFAIGKVGDIRGACSLKGHQVRILHEPELDNAAHASIRRYPRQEIELFELLASEAWCGLVLNKDIP